MQHHSVMLLVHTAFGAVSCEGTGAHHCVECDIPRGATRATISRHFIAHPLPSTSYPPPWIHGCEYDDSQISLSKSCPHILMSALM